MRLYEIEQHIRSKLEVDYAYHPPVHDQGERYDAIRENGRVLALLFLERCPPGSERGVALERLSEAVMWATAAIARGEKG